MSETGKNSCLVIAGEKSGEDHAMSFMSELIKSTPDVEYWGVGGDRLSQLGMSLRYHLRDFSGIGISEVLGKIPFYYKALDEILAEVDKRKTKTAILIDFQGFNLKLAKKLKKRGIKVLYYVAPQAWVWKPWRAKTLEKNVHTLFTILPFEKKWFQDRGVSKVRSVVHPLMFEHGDKLKNIRQRSSSDFDSRPAKILVLPGSRNSEVSRMLPIYIEGLKILREQGVEFELGIVKTESVRADHYEMDLDFRESWNASDIDKALNWCDLSVATSGTVTLTTGLYEVPTVVCYQMSLFTEFVFSLLIPYEGPASLTNIVHDEMLFPEFIQYRADRYNVAKSLKSWIQNKKLYDETVNKLKKTKELLTGEDFSVAEYMASVINEQN